METSAQHWPVFVVAGGPMAGKSFTISHGRSLLGRAADVDVVVDDDAVSRHHAAVDRDGDDITLEDLGSRNGTTVNGERVRTRMRLRAGDVVTVGNVQLQFGILGVSGTAPHSGESQPRGSYDFGDVHGPVNAGSGALNSGSGQQYVAGGDLHHGNWYDIAVGNEEYDGIFEGRGPGRVIAVLGSIAALAGFAIWMGTIFSGFSMDDPTGPTPFDRAFAGIPTLVIGFALVLGGGVIGGVGAGMSKAALRREKERQRRARRGSR